MRPDWLSAECWSRSCAPWPRTPSGWGHLAVVQRKEEEEEEETKKEEDDEDKEEEKLARREWRQSRTKKKVPPGRPGPVG